MSAAGKVGRRATKVGRRATFVPLPLHGRSHAGANNGSNPLFML